MATPPPTGLNVELSHAGFRCDLAPAHPPQPALLPQFLEAASAYGMILTVVFSAAGGLLAASWAMGPQANVATWFAIFGPALALVLGGAAVVWARHALPQASRWRVAVDHDAVRLQRVVLGQVWSTRVLPLESVRAATLTPGAPNELAIRSTRHTVRLRTTQRADELAWIAAAIDEARTRKADFWRDVLAPERLGDREALGRLVPKDR